MRKRKEFDFWRGKWSGFFVAENRHKISGYLADLQWFGRSLSTEKMHDITTCRSFDRYVWKSDRSVYSGPKLTDKRICVTRV